MAKTCSGSSFHMEGVRQDVAMIERFRSETLSKYPLSRMLDGTRRVYELVKNA